MVYYKVLAQNWHAVTSIHMPLAKHHMAKSKVSGSPLLEEELWQGQRERNKSENNEIHHTSTNHQVPEVV